MKAVSALGADEVLVATVTVRRDGSTGCRLSFGDGVRFSAGEAAVQLAIFALRKELEESGKCPANKAARS